MASSAGDKPRKAQGIRIDSSLISKGTHIYICTPTLYMYMYLKRVVVSLCEERERERD